MANPRANFSKSSKGKKSPLKTHLLIIPETEKPNDEEIDTTSSLRSSPISATSVPTSSSYSDSSSPYTSQSEDEMNENTRKKSGKKKRKEYKYDIEEQKVKQEKEKEDEMNENTRKKLGKKKGKEHKYDIEEQKVKEEEEDDYIEFQESTEGIPETYNPVDFDELSLHLLISVLFGNNPRKLKFSCTQIICMSLFALTALTAALAPAINTSMIFTGDPTKKLGIDGYSEEHKLQLGFGSMGSTFAFIINFIQLFDYLLKLKKTIHTNLTNRDYLNIAIMILILGPTLGTSVSAFAIASRSFEWIPRIDPTWLKVICYSNASVSAISTFATRFIGSKRLADYVADYRCRQIDPEKQFQEDLVQVLKKVTLDPDQKPLLEKQLADILKTKPKSVIEATYLFLSNHEVRTTLSDASNNILPLKCCPSKLELFSTLLAVAAGIGGLVTFGLKSIDGISYIVKDYKQTPWIDQLFPTILSALPTGALYFTSTKYCLPLFVDTCYRTRSIIGRIKLAGLTLATALTAGNMWTVGVDVSQGNYVFSPYIPIADATTNNWAGYFFLPTCDALGAGCLNEVSSLDFFFREPTDKVEKLILDHIYYALGKTIRLKNLDANTPELRGTKIVDYKDFIKSYQKCGFFLTAPIPEEHQDDYHSLKSGESSNTAPPTPTRNNTSRV